MMNQFRAPLIIRPAQIFSCADRAPERLRGASLSFARLRRLPRGFSFVEILLATLVLVFGLAGVFNLIELNNRNTKKAANRAIASHLARMKAAEIQAAGYTAAAALLNGKTECKFPESGVQEFRENTEYTWRTEFTQADSKRIGWQVNVSWKVNLTGAGDFQAMHKQTLAFDGFLEPKEQAQ